MAQLLFPLILFAGLYFILIRPQQQKVKEQQALVARAKEGDRVLMTSGVYGVLTEVLATSAYVELADGIEILVNRQSIQEIIDEFPLDAAEDEEEDDDEEFEDEVQDEVSEDDEIEA